VAENGNDALEWRNEDRQRARQAWIPTRNASTAPNPSPNATASCQSARRTRDFATKSQVAPHSKTPVNNPTYRKWASAPELLPNHLNKRTLSIGTAQEKPNFNATPVIHAKEPIQTKRQSDSLWPLCQAKTEIAAADIMPAPENKNIHEGGAAMTFAG
jgi:hypothetical protein